MILKMIEVKAEMMFALLEEDSQVPESHLAACELCGKEGCQLEGGGGDGVSGTDLVLYVSTAQSRCSNLDLGSFQPHSDQIIKSY